MYRPGGRRRIRSAGKSYQYEITRIGIALECRECRRVEVHDDIRIVVRDGIDVVEREVRWVVGVVLRFFAREEAPAAIQLVVRQIAIHEADPLSRDRDAVRS